MPKKNKYTSDQLWDSCMQSVDISCTKCRKTSSTHGIDDLESCDHFFKQGWKATSNHTYCPDCSKKYLKQ